MYSQECRSLMIIENSAGRESATKFVFHIFFYHFLPNISLNTLPKILGRLNPEGWRAEHTARMVPMIKMSYIILFWKYEAASCGIERQMVAKYFRIKDMRAWLSTVQVSGSSETAKNFEICKGRELVWTDCVIICLSVMLHFADKMPEYQHSKRSSTFKW